ncbi:4-hydroxyphenylacetate 3-hydroxylase family protein [Paenibacillus elgii]
MSISRGQQYIDSLKDDRNVWLDSEKIDVTSHTAFNGTLLTIKKLFDMLDDSSSREQVGFKSPTTGEYVHNAFMVPRNYEDLMARSKAFAFWAESTNGVMSRLSDYARSRLTGWYATREYYRKYDNQFAEKIERYFVEARDRNLFLTAVQREPQINRSASWGEQNEDAVLRIVRKCSEGVIVRGAKMIATAGPYTNDFIVYPVQKIPSSAQECATMLIVPANSEGLHILCREAFFSTSSEDHPLSFQYDEMDAVLFFDDVLIPWERVLLYDNPEALWEIRLNEASNSLAYHQTIVRLVVKLEFVAGIAFRIAEAIGVEKYLNVQEQLGELVSQIESIRALVLASEREASLDSYGNFLPNFRYIETARNLGTRYYPRAIEILKQIGAGGYFQMPSSMGDMRGTLSALTEKYLQGTNMEAMERVKLFKLAWDLVGSPLGSRHELYERYYAGDPVRLFANQYINYDKTRVMHKVNELIKENI